jgi:uncharacterized protein YmfQ (DUF2313 family)
MIDFGSPPRTLIRAITRVCGYADDFTAQKRSEIWADNAPESDLPLWERFLNVYANEENSAQDRRSVILGYLNANGSVRVEWFYRLADRLGYKQGTYTNYGGWRFFEEVYGERGGVYWEEIDYYGPAVYFTDGEFLPFRAEISRAGNSPWGDKVYDNIDFGATACVCYYRKGNAEYDLRERLVDLISAARNVGTKILFINTDFLKGSPPDGESWWNWVEEFGIIRTAG